MKKRKIVGLGMALLASGAMLAGCASNEEYQTVYGPPESFDPSENENQDLYGPPRAESDDQDVDEPEELVNEPDDMVMVLYGPPSAYEKADFSDEEPTGQE